MTSIVVPSPDLYLRKEAIRGGMDLLFFRQHPPLAAPRREACCLGAWQSTSPRLVFCVTQAGVADFRAAFDFGDHETVVEARLARPHRARPHRMAARAGRSPPASSAPYRCWGSPRARTFRTASWQHGSGICRCWRTSRDRLLDGFAASDRRRGASAISGGSTLQVSEGNPAAHCLPASSLAHAYDAAGERRCCEKKFAL